MNSPTEVQRRELLQRRVSYEKEKAHFTCIVDYDGDGVSVMPGQADEQAALPAICHWSSRWKAVANSPSAALLRMIWMKHL
jgi:hypothetical protein